VTDKLDKARQERNYDDGQDHKTKILSNSWEIAEIVPPEHEHADPGNARCNRVEQELQGVHGTYTGNKGSKGSDDRQESGDDNRLAPILFVKMVCAFEICPVEETYIVPVKDPWPDEVSYEVIYSIACHGSDTEKNEQPCNIQGPDCCNCPRSEEQRISGKDWSDNQSCFAKDDEKEYGVCPYAAGSDDKVEMFVKMQEYLNQTS